MSRCGEANLLKADSKQTRKIFISDLRRNSFEQKHVGRHLETKNNEMIYENYPVTAFNYSFC
jgi:hypothetical protein